MKLSAPKSATWFIALALGALGALLHFNVLHIGALSAYTFFLVFAGWLLLLIATALKGL